MPLPKRSEWCFPEICDADAARAAYLEDAPGFEEILSSIAVELARSLARGQFFFGVDHCGEDKGNQRVMFQFKVPPQLYDTFFNARTGYRAHYWASAECGQEANRKVLQMLWTVMSTSLPEQVEARMIHVEEGLVRTDIDTGCVTLPSSLVQASFTHVAAKVWICERQMQDVEGPLKVIPVHEGLPLSVVGWKAHAPLPDCQSTLLDLKGGFVNGKQSKDPLVRARDIHLNGWS